MQAAKHRPHTEYLHIGVAFFFKVLLGIELLHLLAQVPPELFLQPFLHWLFLRKDFTLCLGQLGL
jgi:hypothetical protein